MKKNKNSLQFMFILMAAFLLFAGVFLATTRTNYVQKAGDPYESYTKVQSDGDLERATSTLDSMDLNSLDSGLEQNDQDASLLEY